MPISNSIELGHTCTVFFLLYTDCYNRFSHLIGINGAHMHLHACVTFYIHDVRVQSDFYITNRVLNVVTYYAF